MNLRLDDIDLIRDEMSVLGKGNVRRKGYLSFRTSAPIWFAGWQLGPTRITIMYSPPALDILCVEKPAGDCAAACQSEPTWSAEQ